MPKLKTQFVTSETEICLPDPETRLFENYLCPKQIDLVMKKNPATNQF